MYRGPLEEGRQKGQRFSDTLSIPAPVKGWNTIDPLANMDSQFAVNLDNWIPQPGYCELRAGSRTWASGLPDYAYSLIPYVSGFNKKLFAAAGAEFYDVTTDGVAASGTGYSILSAKNWVSQSFSTIAGDYTVACNGTDPVTNYDGVSWVASAITGVSPDQLSGVCSYQNRLWFIQRDSLKAWYLAPSSITGAATQKDLGTVARRGGTLVAVGSWSLDAGDGPNEYLVFLTDQGEAIVYQGIDPSTIDGFTLVGNYRIPAPIGRRCLIPYAGDMLVLTQQGVYPLSKAMLSSTLDRTSAITYNISSQFARDFSNARYSELWDICLYTSANLLFVNVPESDPDTGETVQYVMNTITGAWTRFRGIHSTCFIDFDGALVYGRNDAGQFEIALALSGLDDFLEEIEAQILPAYNYFNQNVSLKTIKMVRPTFTISAPVTMLLGVSADFASIPDGDYSVIDLDFLAPLGVGLWDEGLWDVALWGDVSGYYRPRWYTAPANTGACLALSIITSTDTAQMRLASIDILYEWGTGVL